MKKKNKIQSILAVFVTAFVLTGCGSMRFATTLKPDPEMREQQIADGVKFSIVQFNAKQDRKKPSMFTPIDTAPVTAVSTPVLQGYATDVYPRLFGNDFADLPVLLDVDCTCSNSYLGVLLTGFTLRIIPFPYGDDIECKVRTLVVDEKGYVVNVTDSFILTTRTWTSLFTPLGLLPVPGMSDLPRDYYADDNDSRPVKRKQLAMDSLTEAVARSIRQADPARLKTASKSRKARLRQVDINGQIFWSFLGFGHSKANSKGQRDVAALSIYSKYPTWGAKPIEQVVVARLEDGKWQPVAGYLRSIKELTAADVLLVDGRPSKVVIRKVDKPPLEDFIELHGDLSWNNNVLIDIKNQTLPQLIRKENSEHLIKLITRIEKAILELNKRAQMADSRVQQMVVEGKGADTTQANELSVLCRQRIAIFKPILSALKQAVAARGR